MTSDHSSISSSSSETSNELDLKEDEEWQDAESDEEEIKVQCLFGSNTFSSVELMLEHCKSKYNFDLVRICYELDVDFLETIKLVNFIRSEVQRVNMAPDLSSKSAFEDGRYLQPVLADDPLLYSLNEIVESVRITKKLKINGVMESIEKDGETDANGTQATSSKREDSALDRVHKLEEELKRLQRNFAEYREVVDKTLENRWNSTEDTSSTTDVSIRSRGKITVPRDDDTHYFSSYSFNDIHETMLKDSVRTDAYRDFIYDNKHLFKGKVVLDVGCGTGILSMFCARAGAAKVIAVDNSDIIDKAREIVHENSLGNIITCLRGKIEEVTLPVSQVEIIISEWMGYCLLYEAMLDSVIWARDRYLAPNGLMIPSHMTLHVAPFADSDFITDNVTFWQSVYGFNMTSMLANIHDEVYIHQIKTSSLPAQSSPFLQLPLHFTKQEHLTFAKNPFSFHLTDDIDSLDGFVIWFDAFFQPSREHTVPVSARADHWPGNGVAFTTGPGGLETHWSQGVLLINYGRRQPAQLRKGQTINGTIGYKKRTDNQRQLDIEIKWEIVDSEERGMQLWSMR